MTEKEKEIVEFKQKHDVIVTDRKTYEMIKKVDITILIILIISTVLDLLTMFK